MKELEREKLLPEGFTILDIGYVAEADDDVAAAKRFMKRNQGAKIIDVGKLYLEGNGEVDLNNLTMLLAYQGPDVSQEMSGWIAGDL